MHMCTAATTLPVKEHNVLQMNHRKKGKALTAKQAKARSCGDNLEFLDELGASCQEWRTYHCSEAEDYGLSPKGGCLARVCHDPR